MSLGVARNTPVYIIRQELEIEHMEYVIRERSLRFMVDMVKICTKNKMREIMNKNPSKWGRKV